MCHLHELLTKTHVWPCHRITLIGHLASYDSRKGIHTVVLWLQVLPDHPPPPPDWPPFSLQLPETGKTPILRIAVLTVAAMLCVVLCVASNVYVVVHRGRRTNAGLATAKTDTCRRPAVAERHAESQLQRSPIPKLHQLCSPHAGPHAPQSAMNPDFEYVLPTQVALLMNGHVLETEVLRDPPGGSPDVEVSTGGAVNLGPSKDVSAARVRSTFSENLSVKSHLINHDTDHGASAWVITQRQATTAGWGASTSADVCYGRQRLQTAAVSAPVRKTSSEGRAGELPSSTVEPLEAGSTVVLSPLHSTQHSTPGPQLHDAGDGYGAHVSIRGTTCTYAEICPAQEEGATAALPVAMEAAQQLRRLHRQLDSFGEGDRLLGRFEMLGRQHRRVGGVNTSTTALSVIPVKFPA